MNRNLKAVCALSLTGLLLFSLSGCGGEKNGSVKNSGARKLTIYWGAFDDYKEADIAAFQLQTGNRLNRQTN